VAIAKQQQWAQLQTKRTIVEPEATRSIAESGAGGDCEATANGLN